MSGYSSYSYNEDNQSQRSTYATQHPSSSYREQQPQDTSTSAYYQSELQSSGSSASSYAGSPYQSQSVYEQRWQPQRESVQPEQLHQQTSSSPSYVQYAQQPPYMQAQHQHQHQPFEPPSMPIAASVLPAVLPPPAPHNRPTLPEYPAPPPGVIPPYAFGGHHPNPRDELAPKVGQTRCYWSLLSSRLTFAYLDPVLQLHLGPQGPSMASRCILDFVHPDEVEDARNDLNHVLQSTEDMGSVTRVRFLRLSAIRIALGASRSELALWKDQERIAFDNQYMAVDLVITWVAEGLLLCFIHAIVDLSKADNNERSKTSWTNWCGGALMDERYATGLKQAITTPYLMDPPRSAFPRQYNNAGYRYQAPHSPSTTVSSTTSRSSSSAKHEDYDSPLQHSAPPAISRQNSMPDKVFQVLHNDDSRRVLCSYPPTGYDPEDFSEMARGVSMTASGGGQPLPRTNCTRRLENANSVVDRLDGHVKNLRSVYIPHGCVIFACHKVQPGDPEVDEPHSYQQDQYTTQASYTPAPPPYSTDPHRQRSHDNLEQHDPYATYQSPQVATSYPPSSNVPRTDLSNDYNQYAPAPAWPLSAPSYPSSMLSPVKYVQPVVSDTRTSIPSTQFQDYDRPQRSDGGQARHIYSSHSSNVSQPLMVGTEMREHYNRAAAYSHDPQASQWSPTGVWGTEAPGSAVETPSGGIDGLPLPPTLDAATPLSATTSHSLSDYPSGYASTAATSAPATQSHFSTGSYHTSQSHSLAVSPTVVKRSSDEMLYGSEYSSADGRSLSPQRRAESAPRPDGLRQHPSLGITGGYSGHGSYDELEGPGGHPHSPMKEDPHAGTSAGSLVPTHREPCGSRINGNPPPGVTQCVSCGITSSPEWRKGDTGIKNLCNACGLRFARSKQKKEGVTPQRRKKKDKTGAAVKGKKPPKARKIEETPTPPDDSPPTTAEESKFSDGRYYNQQETAHSAAQIPDHHQDAHRDRQYHHMPPTSDGRSHFPLTPASVAPQSRQYGSYGHPLG